MSTGVHRVAADGFGQGTNELYDRARPTYPVEQLDYILSTASNPSGPLNVLELGAGTGIFTRGLLAHLRFGPAIGELRAVEPSAGMRAQWEATVKDTRCTSSEGTFESTGVEDGWADLVVIAQAWHWCPDFEKALIELARVSKPNGVIVLTWNLEDGGAPWVAHVRDIYEKYEQGTPQFRLGLWRKTFELPSYGKLFQPHEEHVVEFSIPTDVDKVVERVFSKSYIAVLPTDEKERVQTEIRNYIQDVGGRKWIDEAGGTWEYPYKNLAVVMRKL